MVTTDALIQLIDVADKDTLARATYFQAQVTSFDAETGQVYIQRVDDEDDLPDEAPYSLLAGFTPDVDDWVLCARWGRHDFVLGKLVRSEPLDHFRLPNGMYFAFGTGSPEGSVIATPGSLYLRSDGGSNTALYVKVGGSGNTGWLIAGGGFNPVPNGMPGVITDPAGAATVFGSNNTYATYLGRADDAYTSVDLRVEVMTAAATITWAEIGIGTSPRITLGGNASITRRGFTNVASSFNSTGEKTVNVSVTGIEPGDHLWALVGSQATTPFQLMKAVGGLLSQGNHQNVSTTRISTMASPTSFNASTNPSNTPFAVAWYGA